jgi:hypothetical protein
VNTPQSAANTNYNQRLFQSQKYPQEDSKMTFGAKNTRYDGMFLKKNNP